MVGVKGNHQERHDFGGVGEQTRPGFFLGADPLTGSLSRWFLMCERNLEATWRVSFGLGFPPQQSPDVL